MRDISPRWFGKHQVNAFSGHTYRIEHKVTRAEAWRFCHRHASPSDTTSSVVATKSGCHSGQLAAETFSLIAMPFLILLFLFFVFDFVCGNASGEVIRGNENARLYDSELSDTAHQTRHLGDLSEPRSCSTFIFRRIPGRRGLMRLSFSRHRSSDEGRCVWWLDAGCPRPRRHICT